MKILLLLPLALVALTSARFVRPAKDSNGPVQCEARVEQYPVRGLRLQQTNDGTNSMARSYYRKFSIQEYNIRDDNRKPKTSQFQVAIEYKTPKQEYLSGNKRVKMNFYNLLFTASLKIKAQNDGCRGTEYSQIGFVELVKTDKTWYRGTKSIIEHWQCNVPTDNQYVMTKLIPGDRLFANATIWGRANLRSRDQPRMVPLKYESSENIVVDYEKHRNTTQFEKLIEKKIFIVQTSIYNNKVLDVVAGVDVMMYLNMMTYNFTNAPYLDITANHSLIRRITDPQKYVSVIKKLDTKTIRDEPNCNGNVPWSGTTTLNPIPKGVRIYTE